MDAIQAARAKAAKRWSKLEDQTVPLFDKLANGQAAKSDIEKLKQLYAAQSKSASEAFDKTLLKRLLKMQLRNISYLAHLSFAAY